MSDYAIVVGIESYPGFSRLKGPCKDARDFYDWVISPNGGGVDPAKAFRCLSTDFADPKGIIEDAEPVLSKLHALFRPLVRCTMEKGHIGKRLFLYVAGHGFADTQDMDSVALFTADAEPVFPIHLAVKAYADWFKRNWAFDELLVLADCCRTTNTFQAIAPPHLPTTDGHPKADRVKAFYGFATGWKQVARERDFGGGVWRGIFTAAVMDALEKAPPNRLGRVTGTAVKDYVHTVIGDFAGDVEITPPAIDARSERDVLFTQRREVPPQTVTFEAAPERTGHELVVSDGGLMEVHRGAIPATNFSLPLEPGLYRAEVPASNGLDPRSILFEVPTNETIQL